MLYYTVGNAAIVYYIMLEHALKYYSLFDTTILHYSFTTLCYVMLPAATAPDSRLAFFVGCGFWLGVQGRHFNLPSPNPS